MGIRVGIDLGTTFCAVARINDATGKPEIIKNGEGKTTTPSVICFEANGNVIVGEEAKLRQSYGDEQTVSIFKRHMGNDSFKREANGRTYSASDLSAILLAALVKDAEQQSGETIDGAIITVPAYFSPREREATMEAGRKAGLNVIAIISEPTAAAIAYGLHETPQPQTVLIYDLGGGTFDVTIARITNEDIRVLATGGNHMLGGKDWDDCLARYIAECFIAETGVDITEDEEAMVSLLVTAEEVKKKLSSMTSVTIPVSSGGANARVEVTLELFNQVTQPLLEQTQILVDEVLAEKNLKWSDISGVILVGGSTRMKMVSSYVAEMSGKEPLKGINPDEAVALGAAIKANITDSGQALPQISGKTSAPMIAGAKRIVDVTAHAMGMIAKSADGKKYVNAVIIEKNSTVPVEQTKDYSLRTRAKDNELEVYVLNGQSERPLDNTLVGKYTITGIEHTTGKAIVAVTYAYTSNATVEVSATQKDTGKRLTVSPAQIPEDLSWTDKDPREVEAESGTASTMSVILAIDLSGSMYGEPTEKAKAAMLGFVEQMAQIGADVGLIAFADKTRCLVSPCSDYKTIKTAIEGIAGCNVGGGNSAQPFTIASEEFAGQLLTNPADLNYLVVLTDGMWCDQPTAIKEAQKCHRSGIEVIAMGFGTADKEFLQAIASAKEFASMTQLGQLGGSFSKIAQVISSGRSGLTLQ